MANQNKLAHWLFTNKSVFNPKFTELDWPAIYSPGLHDFATKIHLGDKTAEGRGVDSDRALALEKSVAEAIERMLFYKCNISFLGFAVSGRNGADDHAYNEALERYAINVHLNKKISLRPIDQSLFACSDLADELSKKIPEARVSFYRMAVAAPHFGIVCLIEIDNLCKTLGFSLSTNLGECIGRSFRESLANFAWVHSTHLADSNSKQSKSLTPPHLKEEFLKKMIPLLGGTSSDEVISIPEFQRTEIDLTRFPEFKDCPISPVGYLIEGMEISLW